MELARVCVVIAAYNARDTIQRAVASALAEPEVLEVVVFDDASSDDTSAEALLADDGSKRLTVIRSEVNLGPSIGRNKAIAASTAPLISILDADDFFIPGRFKSMLEVSDWDLLADNILFVTDATQCKDFKDPADIRQEPMNLDAPAFVAGNLPNKQFARGQLGFLKPVLSRAFLDRHGLRYNENMRLGEDYDLYLRCLVAGAKFKLMKSCGYCAVVRGNSLSSQHATEDLKNLYLADMKVLTKPDLSEDLRSVLSDHAGHIRSRYEHRWFLDLKRSRGLLAAASFLSESPRRFRDVTAAILRDKMKFILARDSSSAAGSRLLMPVDNSL